MPRFFFIYLTFLAFISSATAKIIPSHTLEDALQAREEAIAQIDDKINEAEKNRNEALMQRDGNPAKAVVSTKQNVIQTSATVKPQPLSPTPIKPKTVNVVKLPYSPSPATSAKATYTMQKKVPSPKHKIHATKKTQPKPYRTKLLPGCRVHYENGVKKGKLCVCPDARQQPIRLPKAKGYPKRLIRVK